MSSVDDTDMKYEYTSRQEGMYKITRMSACLFVDLLFVD